MSAAMSKRQQARNERALQDLIKTVPGNNVCADCQARNPGESLESAGFCSRRCANAIHRMGELECKFFQMLLKRHSAEMQGRGN